MTLPKPSSIDRLIKMMGGFLGSKLNVCHGLLWTKIKGAWAIPENLLKEMVDLGSIIVVIIERNGKVQEPWFENTLIMGSTIRVRCERSSGRIPCPQFPKAERRHA